MNHLAHLKALLRSVAGRLVLAAVAWSAPVAAHAAPLPYYPATVLPAPDGQATTGLQFLAVNGQSDYLLKVLPVVPNETTAQSAYYVAYTGGQYLTLLPPMGATNAQLYPSSISERAADGSFYVVGSIANFPDPDTTNPPDQTPGGRGIAWHVLSTGAVAVIPLQGLILGEDSAFPDQEQSATPVAINSSGYAVGSTDSYLLGLNAYWDVPGITCYLDKNVPGSGIGATNGLDEQGDVIGYDSDESNGDTFYRTPDGTVTVLYQSASGGTVYGGYELNALRNGYIGGSYQVPYDTGTGATLTPTDAIVYDIATSTLHDLGAQSPPAGSGSTVGYASISGLDNAGDAIGQAYTDYAVWLRDRNSGAYTRYLFMPDILSTFSIGNGPSENNTSPHAILDDGTLVINATTPYDRNNQGGGVALIELLKPGADPRSAVTSATSASGSSYQPFSYQITATNNPTSFQAGYLESGYDSTLADLPSGLTLDPATGIISGNLTGAGKFVFDVAGVNGQGVGILPTRVTLTVTDLAGVPTVNSAYSAYGDTQEPFSYQITATNNPTSFSASGLPPGLTVNTSTGVISGQPTAVGTSYVTIQAANAVGVSAPSSVNIQINDGVITSPRTATATVGQAFSYQITASGVPSTSTVYYYADGLPGGLSCAYDTGLITGTPADYDNPGTFNATVSVYNAAGDGAAATVVLTLNAAAPPPAPSITSPLTVSATVGQPFSYQITVSGITPTMYYSSYLPDGLTLDPTSGLISGTPASDNPLPVYNVSLDARDTVNGGDAVGTLTINLAGSTGTAPTPVITSPTTATATVGQPFSYQVTALNITPTYYAAYGLPDGVTINNATGLISGTPAADAGGIVFDLQLFVRDNASHTAGGVLSITVYPAGTATPTPTPTPTATPTPTPIQTPTPTPTPNPTAGTDDLTIVTTVAPNPLVQNGLATYHVVITNHGPDTATGVTVDVDYDTGLTFVAQGSASVTQQTSTFLTVPLADLSASGTGSSTSFDLIFRVTASSGQVACSTSVSADQNDANLNDNNVDLLTTVNGGTPAAHAPTINAPAGGTITVGQTFGYQITTLGDVAVDTYGATGLPDGLAIDATSGIISGTPTANAKLGAASVTLSAGNGAGRSTSTRTFTVVAAPTGKTSDVFATLTGLKVEAPTGGGTTGKYTFKGSISVTNQGKKPAKKVAVGVYLSNSPYFSFPAVAGEPGLTQVEVFLDTSNPLAPVLELTPAGGTVMTAVLPITLAKAGDPLSTLGPVSFKLKISAKRVITAAANYRYLLVVIDPANTLKESNKANNITAIDLQAQTQ